MWDDFLLGVLVGRGIITGGFCVPEDMLPGKVMCGKTKFKVNKLEGGSFGEIQLRIGLISERGNNVCHPLWTD